MNNLNNTPNNQPLLSGSADVAPPSAPAFNLDESVVASVENNVPNAKAKMGGRTFLTGFAGAALACMLAFGVQSAVIDPATAEATGSETAPLTQTVINTNDDVTLPEAVAAKCLPSVVAVDVYVDASASMGQFAGMSQQNQSQQGDESNLQAYSQGSGVVLSQDGYIITNNHVVEGGSAYKVTVGGETYDAELVGADPSSDVAVLKAKDAKNLTVMELGDSDDLTIGEWVMTLGSPFGLEQSVATGIVSATSRSQIMDAQESMQSGGTGETTIYPNMIQTDAAINPGNSGGALVDSDGKLIGINTLITSYSGNYSGVGFAIPVNYAVNLANQIIAGENPTHAQLGVSLSSVNDQTASAYGLPTDEGAYVAAVSEGSGAAAAGIQAGDIITAFDGEKVESASDLMLAVRGKQPGDTVKLTVNTDGKEREVAVTLGDDSATQQEKAEAEKQEQQAPETDQRGKGDNQSTPDNGDQRGNEGWGQDDRGNGYGDDYGYGWGGGNDYGYGNGGSLEDLFGQR